MIAPKLLVTAAAIAIVGPAEPPQLVQPLPAQSSYAQSGPDTAITDALAQWRSVSETSQLPFDSYASFLLQHPGWPGEVAIRRAAEQHAGEAAPGNAVRYFRAFPPQSSGGRVAHVRALVATGAMNEAADAARTAWRAGAPAPNDEAYLLTSFGSRLTPADHEARVDRLLWSGQTSAAARVLPYVSPARAPVFAARLAFRTNAPTASEFSASTPALYGTDAGYVADRATWLRNNGAGPSARAWLAQPRRLAAPPGDAEAYLEVLLTAARGAAADGQWQTAYDIGRQVDDAFPPGTDVSTRSYGERDDYTSLAWIAAQAARKLERPADAMTLFERYGRGSPSPSVRSKGLYWAARAADDARLSADAGRLWGAAAGYRDQFYGQLANEHLGRALQAPSPVPLGHADALMRAAFNTRETVRAARLLGNLGLYEDQTAFIRQIALDAKTDTDHLLADELARALQRPDLAVMVGRSAVLNGVTHYSAAGFPTVPVPAGYQGDWTIIHAIARQESQFNRAALSHAGARGLMQLMPGTAREQAGKDGIGFQPVELTTDPDLSMKLGAGYFRRVYANYGSYPLAIAAYNAGGGNVNKWLRLNGDPRTGAVDMVDWIEAIPYQETRNYVQRVLENAVVYDLIRPDRAISRGPANLSWYLGRRPG